VRDFLKPLARMPKLHSPPASGELGFGPAGLRLIPHPSLVVGEGDVGYDLFLAGPRKPARLGWRVTTTLVRLDGRGRRVARVERARRRLAVLGGGRGGGFDFPLEGRPAAYRLTSVFRSRSGRKLGGFGFYFRLVTRDPKPHLALNATSFRAGQSVFSRVENFGSTFLTYGVSYWIERFAGTAWAGAPESPRGPSILVLLASPPGMSGRCSSFWVPPGMAPGRYRVVKEVEIVRARPRSPAPAFLTAEFEIVP